MDPFLWETFEITSMGTLVGHPIRQRRRESGGILGTLAPDPQDQVSDLGILKPIVGTPKHSSKGLRWFIEPRRPVAEQSP